MEVGVSRRVPSSSASQPSSARGDVDALGRTAALAAPVTLAGQQVLPVVPALAELLPTGLRRGSALAVTGDAALSMALAVAAAASADGAWLAVVGIAGVGLGAAAGFGVALERLVVIHPGPAWPAVLGIVVDGFDLVIARPPRSVPLAAWRRASARLRERGGVLLVIDPPPAFEVAATISTTTGSTATGSTATGSTGWVGLENGAGSLRARTVIASIGGRGAMARVRRSTLCLPGRDGTVQLAGPAVATEVADPTEIAAVQPLPLRSAG